MRGLPRITEPDRISKITQVNFGGLNHNVSAKTGEIFDMSNMTSDFFPVISPRAKRYERQNSENMFIVDTAIGKDNWYLSADGILSWEQSIEYNLGSVNHDRYIVAFQDKCIVMPDKKMFTSGTIQTGTPVTIDIPDLEFAFTCKNRLWGCAGNTIYASKLGDPTVFNDFSGVSTDSWAADVADQHVFTGAYEYRGYPMFFKEQCIYRIYGSLPSNYEINIVNSDGVKKGFNKTLAECSGILFYYSPIGVVAYTGNNPQDISEPFGIKEFVYFDEADEYFRPCAGSDGENYYINLHKATEDRPQIAETRVDYNLLQTYVFNTKNNIWVKDVPNLNIGCFWIPYYENLITTKSYPKIIYSSNYHNGQYPFDVEIYSDIDSSYNLTNESQVKSFVEFADFTDGQSNESGNAKYQIRLELDDNSEISIYNNFDSEYDYPFYRSLKNITLKDNIIHIPIDAYPTGGAAIDALLQASLRKTQLRIVAKRLDNNIIVKPTQQLIVTSTEYQLVVDKTFVEENSIITFYDMSKDKTRKWELVTTIKQTRKRSLYIPFIPRRSDHFRIKIEGLGNYKIFSITREGYIGSEIYGGDYPYNIASTPTEVDWTNIGGK